MKGNDGIAISGASRENASARNQLNAAAIEANCFSGRIVRRRLAEKAREAVSRLFDICGGNHDVDQSRRAVGMRQPARLPDGRLGMMRQNLNAPFRHLTGLDARHGEFGDVRTRFGLDRPLEMRERAARENPTTPGGDAPRRHRATENAAR